MLNATELEEYKALVEKATKATTTIQQMQTEINMHKNQCLEILTDCGYEGFADLPKMKEEITKYEEKIVKDKEEMTSYIQYVSEKKEEKDRIMLG